MSNLIHGVINIEQEAHNIVTEARSESNSKIAEAYAASREKIAEAEKEASAMKLEADNKDVSLRETADREEEVWKTKLNSQAENKFAQAVQGVLDRSLEYVTS